MTSESAMTTPQFVIPGLTRDPGFRFMDCGSEPAMTASSQKSIFVIRGSITALRQRSLAAEGQT